MEQFVAYNSRWRLALLFLGTVGFVVLGMWMVGTFGEIPSSRRYSAGATVIIGWSLMIFSAICAIAIVKRWLDQRPQLEVGPVGIRWLHSTADVIPWAQIIDVTTWSYKGHNSIVLHLSNPAKFLGRGLVAKLGAANRALTGGHISISLTGTDRTYDDAMAAITHFRKLHDPAAIVR